ncbi:MAG: hypothetical protein JWN33_675 [Candidatus Saccharibacteria bacterium]|nr:hypothetical protein [Candidatus Saccharibacteria bacterium]
MFNDRQQIIEDLGIAHLSSAEQDSIIDDYQIEIGEAMAEGLSEQQLAEYERIISGDQATIDDFLGSNDPEYREKPLYKELEVGYDDDPEKVPADKVYASLLWVSVNNPQLADTIEAARARFKANLNA